MAKMFLKKKKNNIVDKYLARVAALKFEIPLFRQAVQGNHWIQKGYDRHSDDNMMDIHGVDSIQVRINQDASKTFYFGGVNDAYSPGLNNTWLFRIHRTLQDLQPKVRKNVGQLIVACGVYNYLLFR
ncbi:MAG: hypothetical protein GY737_02260 [Desulfobacteraceae bacterium]|nr:hypothetical protein [Desulfobacteraceae bacterium]